MHECRRCRIARSKALLEKSKVKATFCFSAILWLVMLKPEPHAHCQAIVLGVARKFSRYLNPISSTMFRILGHPLPSLGASAPGPMVAESSQDCEDPACKDRLNKACKDREDKANVGGQKA